MERCKAVIRIYDAEDQNGTRFAQLACGDSDGHPGLHRVAGTIFEDAKPPHGDIHWTINWIDVGSTGEKAKCLEWVKRAE